LVKAEKFGKCSKFGQKVSKCCKNSLKIGKLDKNDAVKSQKNY
jgi:hypothetical protein